MGRAARIGQQPWTTGDASDSPPPRSQATLLAGTMMTLLAGLFLVEGVRTLLLVRGDDLGRSSRRVLVELQVPLDAGSTALVLAGGLVTVLAVLGLAAALGVVLRRPWGREVGGLLAGVFALIATPLSIGGLAARPPASDAAEGLLIGLANLGIVALLLSRPATSDFAAVEHWRARHRQ